MAYRLSETETIAVVNALYVAAETYRKDAETVASPIGSCNNSLQIQFLHQAEQATKLAEEIDGYLIVLQS